MGCYIFGDIIRRMDRYYVLRARCSQFLGLDLFRFINSGKLFSVHVKHMYHYYISHYTVRVYVVYKEIEREKMGKEKKASDV